ncbi:MAG: tetratricopeptide repeat protein [Ignavibacteriales bacterium]|nr:tetratricopeptide repeat protein [Ignavibacteriales bacterium]
MVKYISVILLIFIVSCSSQIENKNIDSKETLKKLTNAEKDAAQQMFIDASMLDLDGKYAEAILDYQEALNIDPSAGIYYALGKDYLRLSKVPQALKNSKKSVDLEPQNVEYLTLLGTIYTFTRNTDSAKVVFEKIISIDPTDVNAKFNLAQTYEADQPLKSLELYKDILELTGPEWNILIKIADLNERLGQTDETVKTAEELLELNPSSLELQKMLIQSYIQNEKYDKAINAVNNSLEIFPDDISLVELKGNAFVKMKQWEKGAEEYKKILSKQNVPFEIKMRIGGAFYAESLKDSTLLPIALNVIQQIDKDTADWQLNAFMGEISNKLKNDSATVSYFKKAIELAPLNSDLRIRFGQILFENRDYTTAAIEMESAVKKFPNDFVLNFILGLSLAQNSDHEGAIPYLRKAVEVNPNDLNSTMSLSFSLHQVKQSDEALKFLERALRIDSKNVQALSLMGMIYENKDMFNISDSIYDKAVSIDSTDILTLNNFAYSLAERGIKLDKALKMVKKAVDTEPENSSYLDTIGWVYFKMNNYQEAKKYIEKAIEFDDKNATLLDHLGDVYYKLENKEKAKTLWEGALKLDPKLENIGQKILKGLE